MPIDTQERLLNAAEQLFAEQGIAQTSLRAITTLAKANLAAVNYHFQSKEGLIKAVFARRLGPINQQRLDLLAAAQQQTAPKPPALEAIITAFLGPALRLSATPGGPHFMRLIGRLFTEPNESKLVIHEQFEEVRQSFFAAFQHALPHLTTEELFWRFHFMIGTMAHTTAAGPMLEHISNGHCDQSNPEAILRRMTAFVSAGFKTPPLTAKQGEA